MSPQNNPIPTIVVPKTVSITLCSLETICANSSLSYTVPACLLLYVGELIQKHEPDPEKHDFVLSQHPAPYQSLLSIPEPFLQLSRLTPSSYTS